MRTFLALLWDETDEPANATALRLVEKHLSICGTRQSQTRMPGCFLACPENDRGEPDILALRSESGEVRGAIIGQVFRNTGRGDKDIRTASLAAEDCAEIIRSKGAALIRSYWGSYVAVLKCGQSWSLVTDPTASIPCFYTVRDGVIIAFSHLEKCSFLFESGLTINYDFVAALLVYDKISNGQTGLNEIMELQGGARLEQTSHSLSVVTLWDPRHFAKARMEPPADEAAELMRNTTRRAVLTRAGSFDRVAVNLSGGLDSTIVLACLAEGGYPGRLSAVHHEVESGDPSELEYARAAATAAGCDLTVLKFKPGGTLPEIGSHPLSVRPWRQFLSAVPLNGYALSTTEPSAAVFTGQGGDHLFHVSRTPFGFLDCLHHHGPGPAAMRELIRAARLSDMSVWSVLAETAKRHLPGQNDSEMVRTLKNNTNPINESVQARIQPANCLPVWAVQPDGLPPGKFNQVSALLHMFQIRETIDQPVLRDFVHPLISQPLIELCLKLPVYLLCQAGVSRGLARQAFKGSIPELIRTRMTKGETTRYLIAGLSNDLPSIREALLNGALVARGLIDRRSVESFAATDQLQIARLGRRLRTAYAIEAWLRRWETELSRQSGRIPGVRGETP